MTNRFTVKYGPWAVVTGASSGIGAAFARQLAQKGINLVLVARRIARLEELKQELESSCSIQIRLCQVDLSTEGFLPEIIQVTRDIQVGLLGNSAGCSIVNDFLENELQREVEMLQVNNRALLILTHHFGQQMKLRHKGGIILLSSVASFIPSPPWSHYVATKAYTRYLGECLSFELKKNGIDVLTLCPGGVNTEFQEVAGADSRNGGLLLKLAVTELTPDSVARAGVRGLSRKHLVIVGFRNQFLAFLLKLIPRRWGIFLTYLIMDHFKKKKG